jgi:hypothetical protein
MTRCFCCGTALTKVEQQKFDLLCCKRTELEKALASAQGAAAQLVQLELEKVLSALESLESSCGLVGTSIRS